MCYYYRIFEQFANVDLDINLVVCATVQEEVGLRGASAAANMIKPDVNVFVVDCRSCKWYGWIKNK